MKLRHSLSLGMCLCMSALQAAEVFSTSFDEGWDRKDWDMVTSWRWDYAGTWIQQKGHVVNQVPADASEVAMLGERAGETYTSMILKDTFSGNLTVSGTMSFDYRMAPGIIIAADPVKNAKGRWEYREHFEIILFDKGLNVWHHYFVDGKQEWAKTAYLRADFKAKVPYEVTVDITYGKRGPQLAVSAGGHSFGYLELGLPKNVRVGLVASEGVNRFYDFKVTKR